MFKNSRVTTAAVLGLCFATYANANVNKGITIENGTHTSGQSTVNGSIVVGADSVIDGSLETVNGAIRIDDRVQFRQASTVNGGIRIGSDVTADGVESVNGGIELGENARVTGEVSAVNGKIELGAGGAVAGDVSNVNGNLEITGSEIAGDVRTVSGDVWVSDNSTIGGDLVIEKPNGWGWSRKLRDKPKVVVGPGSRIIGKIVAEREIELFISDSAQVGEVTGEVAMEDAERFSGQRP